MDEVLKEGKKEEKIGDLVPPAEEKEKEEKEEKEDVSTKIYSADELGINIQFSIMTQEMIRQKSVTSFNPKDLKTTAHSLFFNYSVSTDTRLGAFPAEKCRTCGGNKSTCQGHIGHLDLPVAMIHPYFVGPCYMLLKNLCLGCFKARRDFVAKKLEKYAARYPNDPLFADRNPEKLFIVRKTIECECKSMARGKQQSHAFSLPKDILFNVYITPQYKQLVKSFVIAQREDQGLFSSERRPWTEDKDENEDFSSFNVQNRLDPLITTPSSDKTTSRFIDYELPCLLLEVLHPYFKYLLDGVLPVQAVMKTLVIPSVTIRNEVHNHNAQGGDTSSSSSAASRNSGFINENGVALGVSSNTLISRHELTNIYNTIIMHSVQIRNIQASSLQQEYNLNYSPHNKRSGIGLKIDLFQKRIFFLFNGVGENLRLSQIEQVDSTVLNMNLRTLLSGKNGHIRSNMCGKRCNYNCRTVLSPNVELDIDEVGIPQSIANRSLIKQVLKSPEEIRLANRILRRQIEMDAPSSMGGQSRALKKLRYLMPFFSDNNNNNNKGSSSLLESRPNEFEEIQRGNDLLRLETSLGLNIGGENGDEITLGDSLLQSIGSQTRWPPLSRGPDPSKEDDPACPILKNKDFFPENTAGSEDHYRIFKVRNEAGELLFSDSKGSTAFLKAYPLKKGYTIERTVINGDYVLANRQPTLHKLSIMSLRARVLKNQKTVSVNLPTVTPFNGDFDGDEMNIHFPHTEANDGLYKASLLMNILHPVNGGVSLTLIQDSLIGIHLLSKAETKVPIEFLPYLRYLRTRSESKDQEEQEDQEDQEEEEDQDEEKKEEEKSKFIEKSPSNEARFKSRKKDGISGRKLLETFLGPEIHYEYKGVSIIKGRFTDESGALTKAHLGSSGTSLWRNLTTYLQPQQVLNTMKGLVSLAQDYLKLRGHSIYIEDISLTREERNYLQEFQASHLEEWSDDSRLVQTVSDIDAISASIFQMREEQGKNDTGLGLMIKSGSKGSGKNFKNVLISLGPQLLNGSLFNVLSQSRAVMPHNRPGDGCLHYGVVLDSFSSGLPARNAWFHAAAGRSGLIDTSINTANIGYLQRKMQRCLEIMHMKGGNLLDSNGVLYVYGITIPSQFQSMFSITTSTSTFNQMIKKILHERGGPSYTSRELVYESLKFFTQSVGLSEKSQASYILDLPNNFSTVTLLPPSYSNELDDSEAVIEYCSMINYENDFSLESKNTSKRTRKIVEGFSRKYHKNLINNINIINTSSTTSTEESDDDDNDNDNDDNDDPFMEAINVLFQYIKRYRAEPQSPHLNIFKSSQILTVFLVLMSRYPLEASSVRKLMESYERQFYQVTHETRFNSVHSAKSFFQAGLVAAQGLGEAVTQITLDTFHHVGDLSKAVVLGMPRILKLARFARDEKQRITFYLKEDYSPNWLSQFLTFTTKNHSLSDVCYKSNIFLIENRMKLFSQEMLQVLSSLDINGCYMLRAKIKKEKLDFETPNQLNDYFEKVLSRADKATRTKCQLLKLTEFEEEEEEDYEQEGGEEIEIENKIENKIENEDEEVVKGIRERKVKAKGRERTPGHYVHFISHDVIALHEALESLSIPLLSDQICDIWISEETRIKNNITNPYNLFEIAQPNDFDISQKDGMSTVSFSTDTSAKNFETNSVSVIRSRKVTMVGELTMDLLEVPGFSENIDIGTVYSDSPIAMFETFGLHAGKLALRREWIRIFKAYSIDITLPHYDVLCNFMFADGRPQQLSKTTIDRRFMKTSPLMTMGFESALKTVITSSKMNARDKLQDSTSSLFLGCTWEGSRGE